MIVEGPGPIRAQLSFTGRPTISYTLGRAYNTRAPRPSFVRQESDGGDAVPTAGGLLRLPAAGWPFPWQPKSWSSLVHLQTHMDCQNRGLFSVSRQLHFLLRAVLFPEHERLRYLGVGMAKARWKKNPFFSLFGAFHIFAHFVAVECLEGEEEEAAPCLCGLPWNWQRVDCRHCHGRGAPLFPFGPQMCDIHCSY